MEGIKKDVGDKDIEKDFFLFLLFGEKKKKKNGWIDNKCSARVLPLPKKYPSLVERNPASVSTRKMGQIRRALCCRSCTAERTNHAGVPTLTHVHGEYLLPYILSVKWDVNTYRRMASFLIVCYIIKMFRSEVSPLISFWREKASKAESKFYFPFWWFDSSSILNQQQMRVCVCVGSTMLISFLINQFSLAAGKIFGHRSSF